jgi:hypothetical protein
MNMQAIADAIAGRFTGVTAGGVAIAVGPTASLPNAIAKGPALLVFHPTGSLEIGMGRMRNDVLTFPVRLLLDPLDYPTRSAALYAWADALRDRVEMDMDLGLAYVTWARATAIRLELDVATWYGGGFDMVELTIEVRVREVVTSVAI